MRTRRLEWVIEHALLACAALSVLTTAGIIVVLAVETAGFLREVPVLEFLTGTEWTPLFADPRFGVLPLVAGTVLVSAIAMIVALPMGLMSAIYLSEYAPDGLRRVVKPVLEVLAGVPTVVYGYFALTSVTPLLQRVFPQMSGFNALSPGIVITDMWDDLYRDDPDRWERTKRVLNILGDKVETVSAWLVEQILTNDRGGNKVAWLTTPKIIGRFLTASFTKRDLFSA